jgi:hypothetical protein
MMEAVRTSETSVDNHFTRQYIPEDNSEHPLLFVHNSYDVGYFIGVDRAYLIYNKMAESESAK